MKFRRRIRNQHSRRKLFTNEMIYLLNLADNISSEDLNLSNRYVHLARKISKKTKVTIPTNFAFKFCRKCNVWWIPSKTVQIRIHSTHITFTCLNCHTVRKKWLLKSMDKT